MTTQTSRMAKRWIVQLRGGQRRYKGNTPLVLFAYQFRTAICCQDEQLPVMAPSELIDLVRTLERANDSVRTWVDEAELVAG